MMRSLLFGYGLALSTVFCVLNATTAFADQAPDCLSAGNVLAVNNDQILNWKTTTKNSFESRAHISGVVVTVYPDASGHHHMSVRIGEQATDTVEVVYNEDFGSVPAYGPGSQIEACGDYITAFAQAGVFPPSPDGAVVHWIHQSPDLARHASGYLMIDGVLCGDLPESAGPKRRHH
jgi:hypothetical protein